MAKKALNYFLAERKCTLGKLAGKVVIQAQPTDRERVDFRSLCEEVARNTTFSPEEVAAVINLTTKIAKLHVEQGESVTLGDLGTLMPYFRSQTIEKGGDVKFNPLVHISNPVARLLPSRRYFELGHVSFEQVAAPAKKTKKAASSGESGSGNSSGGGSGFDGH